MGVVICDLCMKEKDGKVGELTTDAFAFATLHIGATPAGAYTQDPEPLKRRDLCKTHYDWLSAELNLEGSV